MEAVCYSETFMYIYKSERRQNPENKNLDINN
jgi:hypothetical protein